MWRDREKSTVGKSRVILNVLLAETCTTHTHTHTHTHTQVVYSLHNFPMLFGDEEWFFTSFYPLRINSSFNTSTNICLPGFQRSLLSSYLQGPLGFPGGSDGKECTCNPGDLGLIPRLGMATHCNILAWSIPWTEEPGRLQSMGPQRIRPDWLSLSNVHRTYCR